MLQRDIPYLKLMAFWKTGPVCMSIKVTTHGSSDTIDKALRSSAYRLEGQSKEENFK
jgi:hypothetical protein